MSTVATGFRLLALCVASLLAYTAYPIMGEVRFQARHNGTTYTIQRARNDKPVVVLPNGKTATPDLNTMGLFPVAGPETQVAPDWIYVDTDKAESSSLTIIGEGTTPINNELRLRFLLEAPTALKNVFAVVYIDSEHGGRGCLVREVGDMVAFKREKVAFEMRLNRNLGRTRYDVYVFADGKELRQQLRIPNAFEARIAAETWLRKRANETPLPQPYLTFAPRGIKKSTGRVLADVSTDRAGRVCAVIVKEGASPDEIGKIVEAVSQWWFVPTRDSALGDEFRVSLDLSALARWSGEAVQVLPAEVRP